ncbi:hypothetical protein [Rubrivirga sp.]|uniref:hypothetical protein n=1 Tax=Rubrivirga sp. TaxID=1885344 RepID=UPI003C78B1AC
MRSNHLLLFVLALGLPSCAPAAPADAAADSEIDLEDVVTLLCRGSVTTAPSAGDAGRHITWTAYTSESTPASLGTAYARTVSDTPSETDARGCTTWRVPADAPSETVSICPVSAAGPWSGCPEPVPDGTRAVMLSSSMSLSE